MGEVEAVALPETDALRAAFEEHYPALLRLGVLLTGRREVAEDLAQESFVRLAPKIDRLQTVQVGAYLRQTAVNLWRNRLRRQAVERRFLRRIPLQPAEAMTLEDRDELWNAVLRLAPRQRLCLVFRFYLDLPEREVASLMRCSIGAVKSQTSRALSRLRRELSK
ncbi:MAG: SigE family RNA polymerase sigma factor [bacterium]